jgi:hypothetical protein
MRNREENCSDSAVPFEVRYVGMGRASFSGLSRPQGFSITRQAADMVVIVSFKYTSNCFGFARLVTVLILSLTAYHLALWLYKDLFRDLPPHFPAPLPQRPMRACLKRLHAHACLPVIAQLAQGSSMEKTTACLTTLEVRHHILKGEACARVSSQWMLNYAMQANGDALSYWYRAQTEKEVEKRKEVQMQFKCSEPTSRYARVRARPVQSLHATKNTVRHLVIWYTARMLLDFADPPICKSPHSLHKCPSRSSLLWYRVVVSLIN